MMIIGELKGSGEITLEYHLAFDSDIALNTGEESAAIPGRSVIGAMAEIWLRNHPADATFDRLFLTGETRWSDLTPVIDGRRSEAMPLMMVWRRDADKYVNLYTIPKTDITGKQKTVAGQFSVPAGGRLKTASVPRRVTMHHRHEGRGLEAMLYQQSALELGMVYGGIVTFPAALGQQVLALLRAPGIRLGHSRSAQYGACRVVSVAPVNGTDEAFMAEPGEKLYAVLQSNMQLSIGGIPRADDEAVRGAIAEAIGADPSPVSTDYCAYLRLGGYQASWGLRKPQSWAAAAGSVYCFAAAGGAVQRKLTLGEYQQEGMGRVLILRERELPDGADRGAVDRDTPAAADVEAAQALGICLTIRKAEAAASRYAEKVFRRDQKTLAAKRFSGMLNRIRNTARNSDTAVELKTQLKDISESGDKNQDNKKTALKLFADLYGEGSDRQIAETLLSEAPELRDAILGSTDALRRFAGEWKRPLMQVIHASYFTEAEGGGEA